MSSADENKSAAPPTDTQGREYDSTGFYPAEGKKFRIWALLGWNLLIIVLTAVAAAVLNNVLLPAGAG
jgi:hypothetical protein